MPPKIPRCQGVGARTIHERHGWTGHGRIKDKRQPQTAPRMNADKRGYCNSNSNGNGNGKSKLQSTHGCHEGHGEGEEPDQRIENAPPFLTPSRSVEARAVALSAFVRVHPRPQLPLQLPLRLTSEVPWPSAAFRGCNAVDLAVAALLSPVPSVVHSAVVVLLHVLRSLHALPVQASGKPALIGIQPRRVAINSPDSATPAGFADSSLDGIRTQVVATSPVVMLDRSGSRSAFFRRCERMVFPCLTSGHYGITTFTRCTRASVTVTAVSATITPPRRTAMEIGRSRTTPQT